MTTDEVRKKYIKFFKASPRNHKQISPAPLVPPEDPTTLFTSSGMQQLIPNLMGEFHPEGKRLVNSQPCIRVQDIDEVGDNRHTTFFEMLGNWSLGDYFKKDQLAWFWKFLTEELGLPKEKLWVSVFGGTKEVPKDEESYQIWKKIGVSEERIRYYGVKENWWSRSGTPEKMPEGEIGGPDSEVFYEFTQVKHDSKFGKECHPNCDCGRFLEIGNSVFIQYIKEEDGSLKELPQKNVDFGGGLERMVAAKIDEPDIYKTNIFKPMVEKLEEYFDIKYGSDKEVDEMYRIVADHIRASVFLVHSGVQPDNKLQGYVLRKLLRRSVAKTFIKDEDFVDSKKFKSLVRIVLDKHKAYFKGADRNCIEQVIGHEIRRFRKTVVQGKKEIKKIINFKILSFSNSDSAMDDIDDLSLRRAFVEYLFGEDAFRKYYDYFDEVIPEKYRHPLKVTSTKNYKELKEIEEKYYTPKVIDGLSKRYNACKKNLILLGRPAFRLYETFGYPVELTVEVLNEYNIRVDMKGFEKAKKAHQNKSRAASAGMFKGGLADHSEEVTRFHTATHLLHASLRKVLGEHVQQKGSNITKDRLRFDFTHDKKLTDEEIGKVERMVNEQIEKALPVTYETKTFEEAKKLGALAFFEGKYGEKVKVYSIGPSTSSGSPFSREVCAGPHVNNTNEIGRVRINKQEKIGSRLVRIYAVFVEQNG